MGRRWNIHPMFGIREKLSLSFAALLVIVIVLGTYSVRQFVLLERSIGDILRDGVTSVVALGDMRDGVQRMDSGAMRHILGRGGEGAVHVRDGREKFLRGLETLLRLEAEEAVRTRLDAIEVVFPLYSDAIGGVLAMGPGTDGAERFMSEAQPWSLELKDEISAIQELHLARIIRTQTHAEEQAGAAQLQTTAALTLALLLALAAIYYFGREILAPILQLTEAAERVRSGSLDVEVRIANQDELGQLAQTFNAMTAELRALERTQKARLLRLNRAAETVLGNLTDAIALAGPDGRVETSSRVAAGVFGLARGASARETAYPWITDLFDRATEEEALVTAPGGQETVQVFVDGDERFFYPAAAAIHDDDGAVSGVLLIIRDITQLRLHEELKRDAIATVSHQLKTPLTAIRMALHMLADAKFGALNAQQTELAETAREESDRLFRMVQGLLDMSRLKAGRIALDCGPAGPDALLDGAAAAIRSQAAAKDVAIAVEASASLPAVWADAARIEHVFINLAGNAVKYAPEGGAVAMAAEAESDWVRFEVSDTGPGIPEASLPHVFDPFYRAPDQGDTPGAGLGLAIAQQIAEAHGGRIEAGNGGAGGACFRVWLPRADAVERLGLSTSCEESPSP